MIIQSFQIAGRGWHYASSYFKSVIVLVLIAHLLPALSGGIAYAQTKPHGEATSRLFESIAENNLQGVKINLIGGADLRARNTQNMTPIEMAINKGYSDIVFYLMAYRDTPNKGSPSRAKKAPAGLVNPILAPATAPVNNSQPAVAGVYTPPPGSAPWSATVVTSEPPAPEPKFQGPSPFEPGSRPPGSGLKIIGDVRGPSGFVPKGGIEQTAVVAVEVAPLPIAAIAEPEPAAPVIVPSAVRAPAPASTPILASRPAVPPVPATPVLPTPATIPLHKPSPPKNTQIVVQNTPPTPIDTFPTATAAPVLKQDVATPSPLFDDEVLTAAPEMEPVVRAAPEINPPAAVELVSNALIKPEPAQKIQARKAPAQKPPSPERKLVPLKTTLPGKPRDDRGFFDTILQALSFSEDEAVPKQVANNRIVMDMPPPLPSQKKPDQIIDDGGGWAVKKIETAAPAPYIESAARPVPDVIDTPPASPLTNFNLSLLNDLRLGLPSPKTTSEEFKKSCIQKKSGSLLFCIVDLQWPVDVANLFAASTVLYEGTKAIVRYDEGAATYYHTLFPSQSFAGIVKYYTARYGPPSKTVDRSIAPLASPRLPNPTVIWRSTAPVTKLLTTLEIRTFDDTRGGFPDTRRGVASLYHEWSRPVFPHVSTVELMMLSANRQR